jgi:catalase
MAFLVSARWPSSFRSPMEERRHPRQLGRRIRSRHPEELLEFLKAQLPVPGTGKPDPDAVPRFLAGHPGGRAFVERLVKRPVPVSYAQTTYLPSTPFASSPGMGRGQFGRYRFVPLAGRVSPEEGGKRSPTFLREELEGPAARRAGGVSTPPATRQTGDPTDDVTALWPEDRRLVELGPGNHWRVLDEQRRRATPHLRSVRTRGRYRAPADPILHARSAAYAISYERAGE